MFFDVLIVEIKTNNEHTLQANGSILKFDGFLKVYNNYPKKKDLGILVDEKYGEEIIKFAKEKKITFCLPIEKSGKKVLELEYKDLKKIKEINPDYIKILIRYNPLNIKTNKQSYG